MGISRRGSDSRRKITNSGIGYDEEISDLKRGSPKSIFYRAVIVEVFNDLSRLTDEKISEIQAAVSNPGLVLTAPRNSVIVRIVSGARDRKGSTPIVCYPFMPPYLALPAKAGEQVWVMFENEDSSTALGYWLWRIPEPDHVDDLNYTHGDRKFTQLSQQSTSEKADSENTEAPDFPNGGGTSENLSLKKQDDYETIVDDSESYKDFTPAPVPRFTKRPGDSVLQGSNNTLIVLGEDRTGSSIKDEIRESAGAIDIVVGRGRFGTSVPPTIENTRGNVEVDKNPDLSGGEENPNEGDPDLINDSSRVLASMNTDGDENLGLEYPAIDGESVEPVSESPYVIVKSDEIRIVARKNTDEGINGSIKIVKEGTEGEDKAVIIIQPDGSILISGPKVSLGTGDTDDTQVLIGNDSDAEHLVKGETLESRLNTLVDALEIHTHPTAVGPSGPPTNLPLPRSFDDSFSEVGRVK
jgi:hypothetical protein